MIKIAAKKPFEVQQPSSVDLYAVHDPIPVPEVIESDTEAAWALWDDSLLLINQKNESANPNTGSAETRFLMPYLFNNVPKRGA